MKKNDAPLALLRELRNGQRFLITSHRNPDGDAIGSSLGLARLLRSGGKLAEIWLRDEVPSVLRHLPGANRTHTGTEPPAALADADAVVVLECPTLDRCGLEDELLGAGVDLINIDHHLGNANYGKANWVDSEAPALGEMLVTLADALALRLDRNSATCLLAALVSDTGGFRFGNTTERAFDAAARLTREGALPAEVAQWLYESRSAASVLLTREMLGSLEFHAGGRLATALLTGEMFESSGATSGDTEGLINVPRSIDGVEAAAVVRELPEGGSKVSLRSRGRLNVEEIARAQGGGGHHNAAGFASDLAPAEARQAVIEALTASLKESNKPTYA